MSRRSPARLWPSHLSPAPIRPLQQLKATIYGIIHAEDCHDDLRNLCRQVVDRPASSSAWWSLLVELEARPSFRGDLSRLYSRAVREVPRQGNQGTDAFCRIWVGFARQQWYGDVWDVVCIELHLRVPCVWSLRCMGLSSASRVTPLHIRPVRSG